MKALIGTSGFSVGRARYVHLFPCVEVQHTFYQPPALTTLERWRAEAPIDFEFVLKAWQLITHDSKSPTYRRIKRVLTAREKADAGYFRPTRIVNEAWHVTLACAEALQARTILFQCPASFKPTSENILNLKKFFRRLNSKKHQFNYCWEPRGAWDSNTIKTLCDSLNLSHAVDPFMATSVSARRLYFRLHGRGGWRYEYDDSELAELAGMLPKWRRGAVPPYVFFNNVRMKDDALRFREILEGQSKADTPH